MISVRPGSGLGILRDARCPATSSRAGARHGPRPALAAVRRAGAHRQQDQPRIHRPPPRADGLRGRKDAGRAGAHPRRAALPGALHLPGVRSRRRRDPHPARQAAAGAGRAPARFPAGTTTRRSSPSSTACPRRSCSRPPRRSWRTRCRPRWHSLFSEEVRVVVRSDGARAEAAVMVILPRGRFSGEVRRRRRAAGGSAWAGGAQLSTWPWTRETARGCTSTSAPRRARRCRTRARWSARWRGWCAPGKTGWTTRCARWWTRREAHRLARAFGPAFSPEYRAANSPAAAVHDVLHMEALERRGQPVALQLRQPLAGETAPQGRSLLKLYLRGERLVLSDFMPILEDARVRVMEVDTFTVRTPGPRLHDLLLRRADARGSAHPRRRRADPGGAAAGRPRRRRGGGPVQRAHPGRRAALARGGPAARVQRVRLPGGRHPQPHRRFARAGGVSAGDEAAGRALPRRASAGGREGEGGGGARAADGGDREGERRWRTTAPCAASWR